MKKVYEFAAIPVLISSKMFLGFQYKVIHLLTEIRDGMENVGNLLKAENTSFQLTTFENLADFYKFDQSLTDKVMEKNIVREFIFTVQLQLSVPLSFLLPWISAHITRKNVSAPPAPPSWGEKYYKLPKLNKHMDP